MKPLYYVHRVTLPSYVSHICEYEKKAYGTNYVLNVMKWEIKSFNSFEEACRCANKMADRYKLVYVVLDDGDRIVATYGNSNSIRRDEPAVVVNNGRPAVSIPDGSKVTIRTLSGAPYLFLEGRQVCALDEQQARLLLSAFINNSNAGRQTN